MRTAVISRNFCVPQHVYLTIKRKWLDITNGNFVITDEKGNIMFKVIDKLWSIHDRHVLVDVGGNPIVTFKKKHLSAHKGWEVFKGHSSDSDNLLFRVRVSSLVHSKTELEVFLFGNKEERSSDFKVVGNWFESCHIYAKDLTLIARMHKKHKHGSIVLGKDTCDVTVYPQVDHAFILVLVVILYEINKDKDD